MELVLLSAFEEKKFQITWIEINTPAGNRVIQPGHIPILVGLAPHQKITFGLSTGKRESFVIKQGIAHVTRTGVLILIKE